MGGDFTELQREAVGVDGGPLHPLPLPEQHP
jgi:hypothetical protein